MAKIITVESKIKNLKSELREHISKTAKHWKSGVNLPNGPKRDKWHKKWVVMKQKERELDRELEKSIDFQSKKEAKKKKAKPKKPKTKSFSEHLLSR